LPNQFDGSTDDAFVQILNSKGLHLVRDVFAHHEALIVALLSLNAPNFYQILNRNGRSKAKERLQNRAMAFAPDWLINIVHDRLVQRRILDPKYFKKEFLPFSSVWIDSNTSWIETGQPPPKELCGQQGVSCFALLVCLVFQITLFTDALRCQAEL